jgi:subtilase family serine protease
VAGPTCAYKAPASPPSGYGPCDLQSAYNLLTASAASRSATVAIVDAYNDPNAAADLSTYRSEFGLPACTTANGCFRQVSETGSSTLPSNNASWSQEISLDLDMASAICPNCHILLVEASSASDADLGTAVNEAAQLGAVAISNSYGGSEFSGETSYDADYNHPGIAVTASSGDSDYGVQYPAASPYVTAVGGTALSRASNARGWTESVWGPGSSTKEGAGSGCSQYEAQPSWQSALGLSGCSGRIVADVSADADPNTGVSVYDSYAYSGSSGWLVFGGTSVASPIIASVYALSGNTSATGASYAYSHSTNLNDVTTGTNSSSGCSPAYLCTGEVGYDGPTGMGTPNGVGAF